MTHTAELARRACHSASALIVCLSAVALLVAACETSSSISAGPDPLKCQLSLAAPSMIDGGGGTGTLTVTTNPECAWTATSGAPWISLSPSSGQGSATVELRVTRNEGSAQRDGNITVNSEQVRVSQRPACRFELAPAIHRMAADGGTGRVTVSTTSDCAWTATSDVTWIAVATPVSGTGNGAVTFTVAPNGDNDRTGDMVIGGQRSTVIQAAVVAPPTPPTPTPPPPSPSCSYTISPAGQSAAAAGGAGSVAVSTQAGCLWSAASSAPWITVTSGSSGAGNGSVAFTVGTNIGPARTGSLTIAGRAFTVTQASGCVYTLSKAQEQARANEGSASVGVSTTSACAWTAISNSSWLIIQSGSSGTGNGQVTYHIGENAGATRTGSLTIAGQTFGVVQEGR